MKTEENNKNYAAAVIETQREVYEGAVIHRMNGRCGTSPTGAKGVALEIMDIDKQNFKDIFKPERTTQLTKNPRATQLDAVTLDHGKVVKRIQYKDTLSQSGMGKTLNQVSSGKYNQATLKGTKETADLFNAKAAGRDIHKTMDSTGISTKDTSRIADKYLATNNRLVNANVGINVCRAAKSSAMGAAGITAIIEAGKGIFNGDDAGTCVNNIVSKSSESAVSGLVAGAAGEAAFIGTALVCPPLAVPAAIVSGCVAGSVTGEIVEGAFDAVGDVAGEIVDGIADIVDDVVSGIDNIVTDVGDAISDGFDALFGGWF